MKRISYVAGVCVLALGMVISFSQVASALKFGEPVEGNSWGVTFVHQAQKATKFSRMEFRMTSEGSFKYFDLSESWKTEQSEKRLFAEGNLIDNVSGKIGFLGLLSKPLSFEFLLWDKDVLIEKISVFWDGKRFYLKSHKVPEGGTMYLLGTALIGIGLIARLRSKAHKWPNTAIKQH